MDKKIGHIIFAILLTMSVLTPLVIELFPVDDEISLLSDFEEEDQKENKNELELKDLFFSEEITGNNFDEIVTNLISDIYKFKLISLSLEVVLPPPREDDFVV